MRFAEQTPIAPCQQCPRMTLPAIPKLGNARRFHEALRMRIARFVSLHLGHRQTSTHRGSAMRSLLRCACSLPQRSARDVLAHHLQPSLPDRTPTRLQLEHGQTRLSGCLDATLRFRRLHRCPHAVLCNSATCQRERVQAHCSQSVRYVEAG